MAACGVTVAANAQSLESAALVDALLQKGVLTTQEAEDIKADLAKEYQSTAGGKLDINRNVKKLKLYGDFRGRYELREVRPAGRTNPNQVGDQWRSRFRLRVGAEYQYSEGFTAGFELGSGATGNGSDQRSNNVDLHDTFSFNQIAITKAFAKVDVVKYLDKDLYLDKIEIGFGKFANPLLSTSMMWDADITPGGAWQTFDKTFEVDGTKIKPFITTGQWVVDQAFNSTFAGPGGNSDVSQLWMVPIQGGVDVRFENKNRFRFAATYYYMFGDYVDGANAVAGQNPGIGGWNAAGNRGNANNGQFGGAGQLPSDRSNRNNDLRPITLYFDYTFAKTWSEDVPLRLTTELLYNPQMNTANTGVQAGLQLGQTRKKGQWTAGAFFQYLEQNAWLDSFTDSDFSGGSVNRWGGRFNAGYALTDFATINATYFLVDVIRQDPAQWGLAANTQPTTEVGRLQLDISVRF